MEGQRNAFLRPVATGLGKASRQTEKYTNLTHTRKHTQIYLLKLSYLSIAILLLLMGKLKEVRISVMRKIGAINKRK